MKSTRRKQGDDVLLSLSFRSLRASELKTIATHSNNVGWLTESLFVFAACNMLTTDTSLAAFYFSLVIRSVLSSSFHTVLARAVSPHRFKFRFMKFCRFACVGPNTDRKRYGSGKAYTVRVRRRSGVGSQPTRRHMIQRDGLRIKLAVCVGRRCKCGFHDDLSEVG